MRGDLSREKKGGAYDERDSIDLCEHTGDGRITRQLGEIKPGNNEPEGRRGKDRTVAGFMN